MTEALPVIWFFLWALLWAVYFMLGGFDLGISSITPFLKGSDRDMRAILNAQGPFWDGNEVWLVTAGGVTFAAFPQVYATMFSGLYTPLMLLLFGLILRAVGLEFRSKMEGGWTTIWEWMFVIGGFVPALLFGVAFANIFQGLPIAEDRNMYTGILELLNIYGLAGGVLFVLMFAMHGTFFLGLRVTGDLQERTAKLAARLWPVFAGVYLLFVVLTAIFTNLLDNYLANPVLLIIPLLAVAGIVVMRPCIAKRHFGKAWIASALTIVMTTFFGVVGMFPALLPSSLDAAYSLTAYNSSASTLTLSIMFGVTVVFIPIIIVYQAMVYRHFLKPLTDEDLDYNEAY